MKFRDRVIIKTDFHDNIEGFVLDERTSNRISESHNGYDTEYLVLLPCADFSKWFDESCVKKAD